MPFVLSAIFVLLVTLGGAVFYFWFRRARKSRLLQSLNSRLFLIRLPEKNREGKEVKTEIAVSEQFFASLLALNVPIVFEVAVPYVGEEIHFYASVPEKFADPFVRQVHALFPDAEVEPAEDYNIFSVSGTVVGGTVKQKEKFVLPLRTYDELNADTFSPILGGLAKVKKLGEGAALQVIFRPAASEHRKRIRSVLKVLRKGGTLKSVLGAPLHISSADIKEAFHSSHESEEEHRKTQIIDEEAIKIIEKKLQKPLFEVNMRVLTSASLGVDAESLFDGITAGFSQLGAPNRNELRAVKQKNLQKLVEQFSFRLFDKDEMMVLTSEELASVYHFPTPFTEIPRIKVLKARESPPPVNIPSKGVMIGEAVYRGEIRPVRIADDDRRRHVYIVGQTGTGKSNFLAHIALEDIEAGKGVAVIDPHGDLVEKLLTLIPEKRLDDVVLFDPSDLERPLGLNMLEYDLGRPEQKTFIVNEMVSIFDKLYDLKVTGGPMFEQYMRNALLLLMEDAPAEPATLMEVARVFTDANFRNRKLERIKNPTVRDFWEKEATKAGGEASLQNMTPYITSKFNTFTANDYMRVIVGQETSAFRFREVIDGGKIFLVNLSKGKIGDVNANLLGMIVVGKLLMASLSRVDILREEERKDFYLYIDEFQNFTTDSIATILSEARKYRLDLTIAHQYIQQLTEKIRDAVFGNVGSLVAFRVGAQDAEFLAKQFKPTFEERDLMNIDNFNAYVKLLIGGETSKPFRIRTFGVGFGDLNRAREIKERSRERYGRDREEIEKSIYRRLKE